MKKYYLLAIAAITTLFTACNSDDDVIGGEETRGVVKTEFTISFPAKAVGGTRMTATTVQKDGNFRGIQDIKLYPFKDKVTTVQDNVTNSTVTLPTAITLTGGNVAAFGPSGATDNYIAESGAFFSGNNAHLYKDVEIEVGTKAFMFYGLAIPSSGSNPSAINGDLHHNLDGAISVANHDPAIPQATNVDDITFCHKKIYDGDLGSNASSLISYVNSIAGATGWSTSDQSSVILGTLYHKFISMKAGSWASVKGAVQQLYSSIYQRTDAVSAAIKTTILNSNYVTNASTESSSPTGNLTFADLGHFPADENLPDGAIYMLWNSSSNQFEMMVGPTNNTGLNITGLGTYVYPAPLYYRTLSNIRTATVSKEDYYNTKSNWDDGDRTNNNDVLDGYGAEVTSGDDQNDMVRYTTRSIALVNQVQYAVGRLDVTVKSNTNSTGKLHDNRSALPDYPTDEDIPLYTLADPNDEHSAKTFDKFPITGILVGNQNSVDYQFHKIGTENYTIYDKIVPTDENTGDYTLFLKDDTPTAAETIHTLVFETPVATTTNDANAIVKIAVEFLNNSGQLFVGQGGEIIYPGSKFYLVGTFDPADTSANTTRPTGVPNQVFIQDYTTTANLVISSLRSAYNTMPDLRSPKLELGLSVNLTWQTGLTQTIEIE